MDYIYAFVAIGLIVWLLKPKKKRRSPEALKREKNRAQAWKADPLSHLDVKEKDNSITKRPPKRKPGSKVKVSTIANLTDSAEAAAKQEDWYYDFEITFIDEQGKLKTDLIFDPYVSWDKPGAVIGHSKSQQEKIEFPAGRIKTCKNLRTNRTIKNLADYLLRD